MLCVGHASLVSSPVLGPLTPRALWCRRLLVPCHQDSFAGPGACWSHCNLQFCGGGQKKYEKLQADLAQQLLEQGVTLADASSIVGKLMPQAGSARLQRALPLTNFVHTALCSRYGITLPPTTARLEKAARRTHQEARRRAQARAPVQFRPDFQIQSGYPRGWQRGRGCKASFLAAPEYCWSMPPLLR